MVFPLAWRNLRRNRRRTLLTLATVIVGCGMIIFNNALFYGATVAMVEDAVSLNAGHLQIFEKGYHESKSLDYSFIPDRTLLASLDNLKREGILRGYTPRIEAPCIVSSGGATEGAIAQSIDVHTADTVVSIHKNILPGGTLFTDSSDERVMLGASLAENIGVIVGQSVNVVSQALDGTIAAGRFKICALVKTGNPVFDATIILLPHTLAKETFAMQDNISSIVVRLAKGVNADEVAGHISRSAGSLEIARWEKLIPEIVQFVVLDRVAGYIFSFILFVVVAFTVLNTIQMSVFERTKEFGVLLALGTSRRQVFQMVMAESLLITAIGVAAGIVLGLGVSAFVERHPFDYSRFAAEFAVWGVYTTVYPAVATLQNVVVTAALTCTLCGFFSLFPALRAMNLAPVDAMRQ